MKKQLISVILMLMVLPSICQTVYPKKQIIDSDTVITFSLKQATKMALVFNDRERLKVKCDSLSSLILGYDNRNTVCDSVISKQEFQKTNLSIQNDLLQSTITGMDRDLKRAKRCRNYSFIASIILLTLLIMK